MIMPSAFVGAVSTIASSTKFLQQGPTLATGKLPTGTHRMSLMTVAHCGQLLALSNAAGRSELRTDELYTGSARTAAALLA